MKKLKEIFPSLELQEEMNVTDIAKQWILPVGWSEQKIGNFIYQCRCKYKKDSHSKYHIVKIKELYNELVKLNPVLKNIDCTTTRNYRDVIHGVGSKFNYEDIKYFIEKWLKDKYFTTEEAEEYRKKLRELEVKYCLSIHWIPAPSTFQKIKDYLTQIK